MAAEAFAWIEFILITVALVVVILIGTSRLRSGDRLSGGLIA
jgi:Sec-independent protein translocase protein TatA